jgi:hypothetical protein
MSDSAPGVVFAQHSANALLTSQGGTRRTKACVRASAVGQRVTVADDLIQRYRVLEDPAGHDTRAATALQVRAVWRQKGPAKSHAATFEQVTGVVRQPSCTAPTMLACC